MEVNFSLHPTNYLVKEHNNTLAKKKGLLAENPTAQVEFFHPFRNYQ